MKTVTKRLLSLLLILTLVITMLPQMSLTTRAALSVQSHIDEGKNGLVFEGDVLIRGWALAEEGLSNIHIYVNGVFAAGAQRESRPDVFASNSSYTAMKGQEGFYAKIKGSYFKSGSNTVEVYGISTKPDVVYTLQTLTYTKTVNSKPYRAYMEYPVKNDSESLNLNTVETTRDVTVSGWVLAQAGVKQIKLYVNGNYKRAATLSVRKDVSAQFPGYPTGKEGYSVKVALSDLNTGDNWVFLRVYDNNDKYLGDIGIIKIKKLSRNMSGTTVTLSPSSYTYDGTAKKPTVTVKYGNETLLSGTEYSVSYSNNTNAGTGIVTIKGVGCYTGTVTKNFTISKASQTITGAPEEVNMIIGETASVKSTAMGAVTYASSNTDVATVDVNGNVTAKAYGSATITITAAETANYQKTTKRVSVKVAKKPLTTENTQIEIAEGSVYNGERQEPEVKVTYNSIELVEDADYTLVYSNNINAGTATVRIRGTGIYDGTVEKSFTIAKAEQEIIGAEDVVNLEIDATQRIYASSQGTRTYTSSDETVATVDSYGTITGKSEGTAVITITAAETNNYLAKDKTVTVNVSRKSMAEDNTQIRVNDYSIYNGEEQKPSITVRHNYTELVENTGYTVAYSNNVNAGEATITITGIGNYVGTVSGTFTIEKAEQEIVGGDESVRIQIDETANIAATAQGAVTYSSSDESIVVVDENGIVTGKSFGYATITITAAETDNYESEEKRVSVSVFDKYLTSEDTEVQITGKFVYNGKEHTPEVKVIYNAIELTKDTDYTVSYSNNINAGTATVTIAGIGKYNGTLRQSFVIEKAVQEVKPRITKSILKIGETAKITAKGAGTIRFTSSDTTVVRVTSDGTVTAKGAGTVKITISLTGNKNYEAAERTIEVTVLESKQEVTTETDKNEMEKENNTEVSENSAKKETKPKRVKKPTLKSTKKKQLTVSFKKISGAKGYEVVYSTNKKFTKKTTKKVYTTKTKVTVKKLKSKKRYYVKVRAYKLNSKNKKVYGKYSPVQKKKVK